MDVEARQPEHNFLPNQYDQTNPLKINHNYLRQQFADYPQVFKKLEKLLIDGDFTLGRAVDEFESKFAALTQTKYAIGVGSGTDALFLSLKALGIDKGDEVITTPYTFFATIGAIVTAGARPVFVDVGSDFNIDPAKIEAAITSKTKAILPVHWSGLICKMNEIVAIAKKHNLAIVEDACHGIMATQNGKSSGSFGDLGCFSMHPLKNLNVWGDGGVIVTNSKELHDKLVLIRNHGLINRDECAIFSYNSRLDTLQAIVANHVIDNHLKTITDNRIRNAKYFDQALQGIPGLTIPQRDPNTKHVYHLYIVQAERRAELQKYLVSHGIDAKVHYPIPMHLQPAAKEFGHKRGDFPICEAICDSVISFPVHEFINEDQCGFVAEKIREFYR